MEMKYTAPLLLILSFFVYLDVYGQRNRTASRERSPRQELVFDNIAYLPSIRSIQFHPEDQEGAMPVYVLGESTPLMLSFDDLRADIRNLYFSIEHSTSEWQSSHLSPLEYAEGFNEDRVTEILSSVNTLQSYTNYQLQIPSSQVRPKLAGNYLLKVYEDADKRRLILTRKFYVVRPIFTLTGEIVPSKNNAKRAQNHKINLTVQTGGQRVNNPFQEVKILVLQNQRPDVQMWLQQPSFVQEGSLSYRDPLTLDFPAGNEFRYTDLRSFRLPSANVADIQTDTLTQITLMSDRSSTNQAYGSVFDENGRFYIRNQDRPNAPEESDYAHVRFQLDAEVHPADTVYVIGAFNDFKRSADNRLTFDATSQSWFTDILLKQGLYDYEYVKNSVGGAYEPFHFSGSHFQTNNEYQILVYFRRPGTTWDEIAAFHVLQQAN